MAWDWQGGDGPPQAEISHIPDLPQPGRESRGSRPVGHVRAVDSRATPGLDCRSDPVTDRPALCVSPSMLSTEQLAALARYNTPTIANAIEVFQVRPRHVGFLPHQVRCLLPDLGPM